MLSLMDFNKGEWKNRHAFSWTHMNTNRQSWIGGLEIHPLMVWG